MLDWEWAHLGHPVEDLAWAEWIVRIHPAAVPALVGLFTGYGDRPVWTDRQTAMLANCHRLLEFCRRWDDPAAAQMWSDRIKITQSFRELD